MRKALTRRVFLKVAGMAGAGFWLTGDAAAKRKPCARFEAPYVSTLEVANPKRLSILQFTDIHFFNGQEPYRTTVHKRTIADMKALTELAQPDLILVTGDFWHENEGGRGLEFMRFAIEQVEALGRPWAFSWGNHDTLGDSDYEAGHKALSEAPHALYRGARTDGNYVLELVDATKTPLWQFVCINSSRNGIKEPQRAWLQTLPAPEASPPRWGVFHIPVRQYDDIWKQGIAYGIKGENVCYDNDEDGKSLAVLKEAGIRTCICGHDHVNDYSGKFDGIDLIYGRATGYNGYGDVKVPKGGKHYVLNCLSGKYKWVSLLANGKTWHPRRGERVEKKA